MCRITEIVEQADWSLTTEVDLNIGGDGTRVRLSGDSHSFRIFAEILIEMAKAVEDSQHPASELGWFLMFGQGDTPFKMKNAAYLSMSCEPVEKAEN